MSTPKKTINQTQAAAAELKEMHQQVLATTRMDEGAWLLKMTGAGNTFARRIAALFGQFKEEIEACMLEELEEPGCDDNWFWQWFRFKYMSHDCEYIRQEVYSMPTTYDEYKTLLLFSSHMEKEIINLLERKIY